MARAEGKGPLHMFGSLLSGEPHQGQIHVGHPKAVRISPNELAGLGGGGEKERNLETLEEKAAPCKEENAWRGGRPAGAVVPAAAACTA